MVKCLIAEGFFVDIEARPWTGRNRTTVRMLFLHNIDALHDPGSYTRISKCRTQECKAGTVCRSDYAAFTSLAQAPNSIYSPRNTEDSFVVNRIVQQ